MTGENDHADKGLLDSLKTLTGTLIAIVYTRLELLSTDLEEERERLAILLMLMLVALFCIGVGLILAVLLIVVAFWDTHRLLVLAGLTALFLVGGLSASWLALHKLHTKPRLFAATLAELYQDSAQLPPR
ncbi:MAG TPA: phage holin family protein [Sulfuriferula sp.]|nr:phage holin family protein [Sulfuriferula sp.]